MASFAIVTVSDWDLRRYIISILPVVALLVGYITLTPRADKSTSLFPSFDIEHATRPLSLRIVALLLIILGIETINFDLPRSNVVATLTLGLVKALTWYFIVQTVCSILYQDIYMMLTRLLDSKFFVAYCNHNRNIQPCIHSQPLRAVFGYSSFVAYNSIFSRTWPGYIHTSTASKSQVNSLGILTRFHCSISGQHIFY